MKHREKIESIIESEIKKRKVMKMSRFIVETEKRRFCEEVLKYYEEKKDKIDRFFQDENLIYQNAKRTKDYLVVIATNKQTRETFYFKQFRRREGFENEKQILHLFKQDENNPFLDLVQMENSRMLLKKKGERYSLIDFAHSIRHQWEERELVFIFEKLLSIASRLKREGIYLGDYELENISLIETSNSSGRYALKIVNADKAVQKKGVFPYNLSNKYYAHPQLTDKEIHLNISEMESSDIWSIIRCIYLLVSEMDYTLVPNDYNSVVAFLQQTIQNQYPFLYQIILIAIYASDVLLANKPSKNATQSNINQNQSQASKNIQKLVQQQKDDDVKLKQCSLEGLLDYIDISFQQVQSSLKWSKLKGLENRELSQQRPLTRFSEQMDLYQFLMKANLFENAVETIERVIQESNSQNEREVLLLNLDYIYCLNKVGMKYKGEMRLSELERSFMKYIQYDFEMLYKFTLSCIVYDKNNVNDLFNRFPQIISLQPGQQISRHYLFYLLQCQLVLKYLESGKLELGLMYNQIAIDYAFDNIIQDYNNQTQNDDEQYLIQQSQNRLVTFDNFTEQKEDILEELIDPYNSIYQNENDDDYCSLIKQKLNQVNLGVCEDNPDLIGQYLFLMEEYELAVNKITDLQTRAACFFYLEKYDEATQIYEGLKDMIHFQQDPSIYLALVMCYYFMEDYQKAYQCCFQALSICDKQENNKNSNNHIQNNQKLNVGKFTKGEEEAYREYKTKLSERSKSSHYLHGQNNYNNSSQKDLKSKKDKQYQRIYEQYNFKASAMVLKAFCEIEIGRVETALENMKYAIEHFERVGLLYEKLDMLENISFAYIRQSFTTPSSAKKAQQVALDGYNQKLKLLQSTGRVTIEIDFPDSLNTISLSFLNVLDYKSAIKYAEESLELILDSSDIPNIQKIDQQQDLKNFSYSEEDISGNYGYFQQVWKQYLYIGLLYDNINNNEKVILCGQKALEMLRQCPRTMINAEEETQIYLLLAHVKKNMKLFEDALKYYVKAADTAEILSKIKINSPNDNSKQSRNSLLQLQSLSFALSVYSSEQYNSNPSNGHWCAQKMEQLLNYLAPFKYDILPKYFLQLSQYLDLINDTSHAIEIAKTAAILHQDIFNIEQNVPTSEIKTKVIIYNTLITMLQSSKRNKEADSYLQELSKFN